MTEQELERTTERLGEAQVRSLDAERIADRVLARLAAEPAGEVRPLHRRVTPWLIGLAAAALVLVALRLTVLAPADSSGRPTALTTTVLQELDGLGTRELEEILEAIPAPAGDIGPNPESVPWSELDSSSLERLLRSLEG